LATKTPID